MQLRREQLETHLVEVTDPRDVVLARLSEHLAAVGDHHCKQRKDLNFVSYWLKTSVF